MKEIVFGTLVILAAISFGSDYIESKLTEAAAREVRYTQSLPAQDVKFDFSNKEIHRLHREMGRRMSDKIIRMNSPNARIIRRNSDDD